MLHNFGLTEYTKRSLEILCLDYLLKCSSFVKLLVIKQILAPKYFRLLLNLETRCTVPTTKPLR